MISKSTFRHKSGIQFKTWVSFYQIFHIWFCQIFGGCWFFPYLSDSSRFYLSFVSQVVNLLYPFGKHFIHQNIWFSFQTIIDFVLLQDSEEFSKEVKQKEVEVRRWVRNKLLCRLTCLQIKPTKAILRIPES